MTLVTLIYLFSHLFVPQMLMEYLLYARNHVGTEDITVNKVDMVVFWELIV